ncbi:MAG: hypothetical protein QOE54_5115, partial [Streptosporangiaceae bacterium]|nr:hypothetical protein [Streptosporangiaceae bacterium]
MPGLQAWATPGSGVPEDPPPSREPTGQEPGPAPSRLAADRSELLGGDIPLRPLGVSETLDAAITSVRRNPRAVLGLALVLTSAVQVILTLGAYFLVGRSASDEVTPGPVLRSVGTQSLLVVIGLVLTAYTVLLLAGMLAPVLGRTLFGLPGTLRQAWRDVQPSLVRLVAVATITMSLSLVAMTLPVVPFILLAAGNAPAGLALLAALVGFPVGLAFMVWLYVLCVLAAPAVVMERQSVPQAFRRARQLLSRRWWRVCGTLLLTLLITIFIGLIAQVPFFLMTRILFGQNPTGWAELSSLAVGTVGRILSWSLIGPFDAGVIALLYIDLRMRREGLDLELQTRDDLEIHDFLDLWRPSPLVSAPDPGHRPPSQGGAPLLRPAPPGAAPPPGPRP